MKSELEKYKDVAEIAHSALTQISCHFANSAAQIACDALDSIGAILHPTPAMEEVEESMGWINIYGPGVYSFEPTEEAIRARANPSKLLACQEIKVKVMRPVPQKVERSVTVDCRINSCGDTCGIEAANAYKNHPECHGKRGKLTFTWEEPA